MTDPANDFFHGPLGLAWQDDNDEAFRQQKLREEAARRLAALAGVDENGGVLPPTVEDLAAGIDRRPNSWWTNRSLRADGAQNDAPKRSTPDRHKTDAGGKG